MQAAQQEQMLRPNPLQRYPSRHGRDEALLQKQTAGNAFARRAARETPPNKVAAVQFKDTCDKIRRVLAVADGALALYGSGEIADGVENMRTVFRTKRTLATTNPDDIALLQVHAASSWRPRLLLLLLLFCWLLAAGCC